MNIKEVARVAKVSTATVSRTINGSDKVSEETALRVRRAIEKLRYYPDTNARALGSGRSSLYGLIISDITNPFFPELVKSFEDVAMRHGKEVLVANTSYDPARAEDCARRMLQRKVDGVAIMTSEMHSRVLEDFHQQRIPLIFLDTARSAKEISRLVIDYQSGIEAALDHLHSIGHTAIAYIAGPAKYHSAKLREKAFIKGMQKRKLAIPAHFIQKGDHTIGGGYQAMVQMLASSPLPTAVMTSNDLTAIGALRAIHEKGLRIPQDISLVGFDDITVSSYTQPPLTTIRIPRNEIAETAFHALVDMQDRHGIQVHPIRTELVIRKSTAPCS
jgi:LacI family transcriptional regulator